ncbi:MAG: chromosomal replication initiator protein DnaA [Corynebacterium sp.]|nr:chromosomal replication initiator protein DnaA [Corynebacterium sp.]
MADQQHELDQVWEAVTSDLQHTSDPQNSGSSALTGQQRGFLRTAKLAALVNGIAVLRVPSDRAKQVVEGELAPLLASAFERVSGTHTTLAVSVDRALNEEQPISPDPFAALHQQPAQPATEQGAVHSSREHRSEHDSESDFEQPHYESHLPVDRGESSWQSDQTPSAYSQQQQNQHGQSARPGQPGSTYQPQPVNSRGQEYPTNSGYASYTQDSYTQDSHEYDQRNAYEQYPAEHNDAHSAGYATPAQNYAAPQGGLPWHMTIAKDEYSSNQYGHPSQAGEQPRSPEYGEYSSRPASYAGYPAPGQHYQPGGMDSQHHGSPATEQAAPVNRAEPPSLNSNYTFDTYVVGDSNKFPWSAASAVAEDPGKQYNPLFIWGGSGLGKTHLLHAIGNYAYQHHPQLRIKYISSEEFTNDYINSLRDDNQVSFKNHYRNLDILMIDDIQFLQGKEGTLEEFFHTFNALEQAGHQIVLSADRSPKELETIEDRLRTRFQSGLIADVNPPNLEVRIAILRKRAAAQNINATPEVFELIANNIKSDVRQLEGALNRVAAEASIRKVKTIDLKMAEEALDSFITKENNVQITADSIFEATAEYFSISVDDLKGPSRRRTISHPRQIAIYLCRELTDLSFPRISQHLGGRDHSTAITAAKKITKQLESNSEVQEQVRTITQMVKYSGT